MAELSKDMVAALCAAAIVPETHDAQRVQALEKFAEASHAAGAHDVCDEALTELVGLLERRADVPGADFEDLGWGAMGVGQLAEKLGSPRRAREAYELVLRLMSPTAERSSLRLTWFGIGQTWEAQGEGERAVESYRKAAMLGAGGRGSLDQVTVLRTLAEAEAQWGSREACDRALTEAVGLLEPLAGAPGDEAGDIAREAQLIGRVGERIGRPARARAAYVIALGLLDTETNPQRAGVTWHDIGDTWKAQGEGERAVESYRRAAELKARGENVRSRMVTLRTLAEAEAQWGSREACDRALTEAVGLLEPLAGAPGDEAADIAREAQLIGRVGEDLGRPSHARDAYALQARVLVAAEDAAAGDTDEFVPFTVPVLVALARVARMDGNLDTARAHLERARARPEADSTRDLASALLELGRVQRDRGNSGDATALLEEAVERISSLVGDYDPELAGALIELADATAAEGDPVRAGRALEWALAAYEPLNSKEEPAGSILARLRPLLEAARSASPAGAAHRDGDDSPEGLLAVQRSWIFELRRRVLDGGDVRGLVERDASQSQAVAEHLVPEFVHGWDERERELGPDLMRAVERFLLLKVIDDVWRRHRHAYSKHVAAGADPAELGQALHRRLWARFFGLLLEVEVETEP